MCNTKVFQYSIFYGPTSDYISEYRNNPKQMVLSLDERLVSKVEVTEWLKRHLQYTWLAIFQSGQQIWLIH